MILQVMARRFFNKGIRPVHRIKHVVDLQGAVVAGGSSNTSLISAVDAPVLANTTEVETACTVNAIYLKVEVNATTSAALANCYLVIFKNPGGNLANPVPNTIGANDNKKYVIHQEMVMLQQVTNSNPRTLFNGVIVIPRGYRRFGINDALTIHIQTPGVNINFCYETIYKEFR